MVYLVYEFEFHEFVKAKIFSSSDDAQSYIDKRINSNNELKITEQILGLNFSIDEQLM